MVDLVDILEDSLVHISRLALTGRPQDVQAQIRQAITKLRRRSPELAQKLATLLSLAPTSAAPLREAGAGMVPIDSDSRLALVKHEFPVQMEATPVLKDDLIDRLDQVVSERSRIELLEARGLMPTRSLLFIGPPGVGKTMSARWLAHRLDRPLIVLDLATVMSSYLGKTGANIRSVLEYAKSVDSVLLLDEFDAIAKRRDDEGDIGELKRLVNVLLQEIDDWPSSSLLVAATNHGELLDPAVWRRFDDVLNFDFPDSSLRKQFISTLFAQDEDIKEWTSILAEIWAERSPSDIARTVRSIRRRVAIKDSALDEAVAEVVAPSLRDASPDARKKVAERLAAQGLSDRRISTLVGISRDTIRRTRSQKD